MIIEISQLGDEEAPIVGEEPVSILALDDPYIRTADPIRYDLTASIAIDSLVTRGSVKADIAFACVRCAEFFTMTVSEPDFLRIIEISHNIQSVDLTDDIRESIILAFPSNPLCTKGCRGVCTQCGTNLNTGECKCVLPSLDRRWSDLRKLNLN